MTSIQNSVVSVFDNHGELAKAVEDFQRAGFALEMLSVIGHTELQPGQTAGYYNLGDQPKCWGSSGVFWTQIWTLLSSSAVFLTAGSGVIVIAGLIVSNMISALEGAVMVGGVSSVGAALYSLGIPKENIFKYERFLKSQKLLLLAHGSTEDVETARTVLTAAGALETNVHQSSA